MKYEITKQFTFEAAHRLVDFPKEHKCHRPHGHTYRISFKVSCTKLDPQLAIGIDFAVLSKFKDKVIETCDHQDLNAVLPFSTTAENIAQWVFNSLEVFIEMENGAHQIDNGVILKAESASVWETASNGVTVIKE